MRRMPMIAPCACEHCTPAVTTLGDRLGWALAAIAFAMLPGRALLHFAGILP